MRWFEPSRVYERPQGAPPPEVVGPTSEVSHAVVAQSGQRVSLPWRRPRVRIPPTALPALSSGSSRESSSGPGPLPSKQVTPVRIRSRALSVRMPHCGVEAGLTPLAQLDRAPVYGAGDLEVRILCGVLWSRHLRVWCAGLWPRWKGSSLRVRVPSITPPLKRMWTRTTSVRWRYSVRGRAAARCASSVAYRADFQASTRSGKQPFIHRQIGSMSERRG